MDRGMSIERKPRGRILRFFYSLFLCFASLRVSASKSPHGWTFVAKCSAAVQCVRFSSAEASATLPLAGEVARSPGCLQLVGPGRARDALSVSGAERRGSGVARGPAGQPGGARGTRRRDREGRPAAARGASLRSGLASQTRIRCKGAEKRRRLRGDVEGRERKKSLEKV